MTILPAYPKSYTRLPLYGLILTLVGLAALLVAPIARRVQSTELSERVRHVEMARLQIDQSLETAHQTRGFLLYSYRTHKAPHSNVSFEDLARDWQRETKDDKSILECGPVAHLFWITGRRDLTEWFDRYARHYAQEWELGDQEEFEKSNDLFEKGISDLQSARKEATRQEDQIRGQLHDLDRTQNIITVSLAAICFALALLAWLNLRGIRRAYAREQAAAAQLEIAVKESNHRIKNNLQVIGALLDMQMQEPGDTIPKSALDDIVHQVRAVAAVHDFLSHEMRSDRVQGDLMLQQLVTLTASPIGLSVALEADAITLAVKQATAVALIANELLLNSGKHGATHASLQLRAEGERASLRVADNGPGFPLDFEMTQHANLGLTLVETLARYDLKGEIAFRNESGAEVEIIFPSPQKSRK
jgi:two-component sensor histidine kinase